MFAVREVNDFVIKAIPNFVGLIMGFEKGEYRLNLQTSEWASLFYITEGCGNFGKIDWVKKGSIVTLTPTNLENTHYAGIKFEFDMSVLEELISEWNKG